MAKQTGTIEQALSMTVHHVSPGKIGLMTAGYGVIPEETVKYRFGLVESNLEPVIAVIKNVRAAAESGDCAAVLKALNEQVSFGHEFG